MNFSSTHDDVITMDEIAKKWGLHKTNVRRYIQKKGIPITKIRLNSRIMDSVTLIDYETLNELRTQEGYSPDLRKQVLLTSPTYFYVVQTEPKLVPTRIKLGRTNDLSQRLATYRSIAPDAVIIHSWPCQEQFENTAVASLTRIGCTRVGRELFNCESIEELIQRGNEFFKLLPNI